MTDQEKQLQSQIPEEYKPISMWGYFGYQLLFSIPCIGFILLIVFALTAKNKNLKNFAASYFCMFIIGLVIFGISFALGGAAALAEILSY